MDITEQIKRAYKKLKSSVYFDKTQAILRDDIVKYESKGIEKIEEGFFELSQMLNYDNDQWNEYEEKILSSIKALCFPKKLEETKDSIIMNESDTDIEVNDNQYFISMDIKGHLLGVLWILYIGKYIDEDIYECSYGNRLNEKLINEETGISKFSNSLFKPYFTQYESWRDYGLKKALEHLKVSKDVVIVTMDFRKFFYSVHFDDNRFDKYFSLYCEKTNSYEESEQAEIVKRLNKFVFRVLCKYSLIFKDKFEKRTFLPIGFLPSNILSNDYLKSFDSAIITRWNPLYYGRYVDDLIIVDKVEKISGLSNLVNNRTIRQTEIIDYFLCKCNADKSSKCPNEAYLLRDNKENNTYYINNSILKDFKGKVEIQDKKVKVFYFKHNRSDALIAKFKKAIELNKSEFRYMPEDDNILESGDYSEIFDLQYSDSINKLSGVKGVSIDKYELSKFLGKYLRVGGLINDKRESIFIEDILKIFDNRVIIENYTLWEKVIEILIINNKFDTIVEFVELVLKSICNVKYEQIGKTKKMESSLMKVLHAGLCRGFSLNWGYKIKECILNVCSLIERYNLSENITKRFKYSKITKLRQGYCMTRMIDKNAMPVLIDVIIESNNFSMFTDESNVNLTIFHDFLKCMDEFRFDDVKYYYYPYIISPQDLQLTSVFFDLKNEKQLKNPEKLLKVINDNYQRLNFKYKNKKQQNNVKDIDVKELIKGKDYGCYSIKIGSKITSKPKIKIALANVKLNESDFINVLTSVPSRSYKRYKNLAAVVREAISNKANILVLPEAYLPIEWLPILMNISAKTQMAIITGIEHVVIGKSVYNLTATILPFKHDEYKYAYLNMHNKVVYSPDEKNTIEGYRYNCVVGKNYELFVWNDLWFPVYCCYEIAAIQTRARFQSIADMVITIEWNHDVNYYSNIIESLNRDLHCYCLQVNTSDYGDSRLIKPSKTENKDIIKIKGGVNSTALIDEINIELLRDFQIKEYGLQKLDKTFKPTPPFFSQEIVNKKRNGTLWESLDELFT